MDRVNHKEYKNFCVRENENGRGYKWFLGLFIWLLCLLLWRR